MSFSYVTLHIWTHLAEWGTNANDRWKNRQDCLHSCFSARKKKKDSIFLKFFFENEFLKVMEIYQKKTNWRVRGTLILINFKNRNTGNNLWGFPVFFFCLFFVCFFFVFLFCFFHKPSQPCEKCYRKNNKKSKFREQRYAYLSDLWPTISQQRGQSFDGIEKKRMHASDMVSEDLANS